MIPAARIAESFQCRGSIAERRYEDAHESGGGHAEIFTEQDEHQRPCKDADPAAPLHAFGKNPLTIIERRDHARDKDQNADKGHENAEHEWEHARAHVRQRSQTIGGGIQGDAGAEQHHEQPGIEILFLKQVLHAHVSPVDILHYWNRLPLVQATLDQCVKSPKPAARIGRACETPLRALCREHGLNLIFQTITATEASCRHSRS